MLDLFAPLFSGEYLEQFIHTAKVSAPLWIPAFFIVIFFDVWMSLKKREWIAKQGEVLLEVRLPREQLKSPQAMELFLTHLHQGSVGTLLDVYLKGRIRPWFSLELASHEGRVALYIWTHKGFRARIEAQLYAQFPNIEIHEAKDYTKEIYHNPEKINFGWFGQFALTKADAYPIKTYIDYGLDRDPKEEFKHDPLVSVIEYLGSLKKGEHAWIQILVRAHAKEGLKMGRIVTKPDWKKDVEKEIKEILKKGLFKDSADKTMDSSKHLSQGQKDVIEAIERTTGKLAFDSMIRATYFAEKDSFNPANIGGIIGSITQFGSPNLNGFKPGFGSGYDYPWQDPFGKKKLHNERVLLEAYKRRGFFSPPFEYFHGKPFILTVEELATLFHFPGAVAGTPTLARIPSKKAEAPSNLPI